MAKVQIKEVPMGTVNFVIGDGIIKKLSRDLYERSRALGEIISNGRDACIRKKTAIEIHINTFSPNSPWFDGHTMVITDHGCGFPKEKSWKDYLLIGDSIDEVNLYGTNGVGKLAPLCFSNSFTVRTCPDNGHDLRILHVNGNEIIGRKIQFFLGKRGDLPTDRPSGSFTSIIIKNMDEPYTTEEIMQDLKNQLVIEPRIITVNGKILPERETIGDAIKITTPSMPKIGIVSCEIGVAEKALRIDSIKLLGGGREICDLSEIPGRHKRDLDPVFFYPQYFGWINVERWLKKSTISKDRLRQDALSSLDWGSFSRALELYLKKPLTEKMEEMEPVSGNHDQIKKTLRNISDSFQKAWPIDKNQASELGFGSGELGKENGVAPTRKPNHPSGPKNPPAKPTHEGGTKDETKKPGIGPGVRSTSNPTFLVKIQDETYRLHPANTAEQVPAYVKDRGNVMVIDLNHPAFIRIKKRGPNAVLTFLERALVEAHVLYKCPVEGPSVCFAQVNHLLSQMG